VNLNLPGEPATTCLVNLNLPGEPATTFRNSMK
jgi:hypothetical protein